MEKDGQACFNDHYYAATLYSGERNTEGTALLQSAPQHRLSITRISSFWHCPSSSSTSDGIGLFAIGVILIACRRSPGA